MKDPVEGSWPGVVTMSRAVWEQELDQFVPDKIFDAHAHVYYPNREIGAGGGLRAGQELGLKQIQNWEKLLFPGRRLSRFLVGIPLKEIDVQRMMTFTLEQAGKWSYPLVVVKPDMDEEQLRRLAADGSIVGFKPYRFYAGNGDIDNCRICDFFPEKQIAIADAYHLIVLLHLSGKNGPAEADNLRDLDTLANKYPHVKWQLAHCARSFNSVFLEEAIEPLARIPNLYYDTSAVCESDVFDLLLSAIPIERILFGTDNLPAHMAGGKYIAYARAWMYLANTHAGPGLAHCDSRFCYMVYEQLRALRRAVLRQGLSKKQVEDIFYNNAVRLLDTVTGQGEVE